MSCPAHLPSAVIMRPASTVVEARTMTPARRPPTRLDPSIRHPAGLYESSQPPSWHKSVAAGLRHQDLRVGGIPLDLLAKPVDMGLERVRRHAGIVAPDLAQQDVAPHDLQIGSASCRERVCQ